MIEIGRLYLKTAGRDAGKKCVILEILDDNYVMIDGETRRRKCNQLHLEPLEQKTEIKKNASHAAVAAEFKKLGLKARETKPKEKKIRPRRLRRSKLAGQPSKEPKAKKKTTKKTAKKANKTKEEK